ncbi:MAG: ATP-binding protein [Actinomycetota bacterium]
MTERDFPWHGGKPCRRNRIEHLDRHPHLFRHSPAPSALMDATGAVVAVNDAFAELTGHRGVPAAEHVVHPDDLPRLADIVEGQLVGRSILDRVDARLLTVRGPVWVRLAFAPLADGDRVNAVIATAEEVTDLRAAIEQQERTAATQRQFAATVSHEIRSPLHAMLGLAELLSDAELGERDRKLAEAILREGQALKVVIDDTLDMARIEAGQIELNADAFSPSEMAASVVRLLRNRAADKGLTLTIRVDAAVPQLVEGDEHRLRQVLVNLVTNAVKFTDHGGIEVRVGRGDDDRVRFVVEDTGIGISGDAQATVFDPFTRYSAESDESGTGLGLAISLRLLEAMHGTIELESAIGVGSTFTIDVPLTPTRDHHRGGARSGRHAIAAGDLAPHVLVVEDSEVNQLLVTSQLDRLGCTHAVAGDGPQAIAMLDETHERVDVILMDWHLPGMDGLQVSARIREIEHERSRQRLPIIAVTARAMTGDRQRCLDAGMDDFLAKPVSLDRLAEALRTWLAPGDIVDAPSIGGDDDTAAAVDRSVLAQLGAELGGMATVRTLVATFLRELPERCDAVERADGEAARRAAHTLKSTAAMLGAAALAERCAAIEAGADAAELRTLADTTADELEVAIADLAPTPSEEHP